MAGIPATMPVIVLRSGGGGEKATWRVIASNQLSFHFQLLKQLKQHLLLNRLFFSTALHNHGAISVHSSNPMEFQMSNVELLLRAIIDRIGVHSIARERWTCKLALYRATTHNKQEISRISNGYNGRGRDESK
jgi:hypothetical protein